MICGDRAVRSFLRGHKDEPSGWCTKPRRTADRDGFDSVARKIACRYSRKDAVAGRGDRRLSRPDQVLQGSQHSRTAYARLQPDDVLSFGALRVHPHGRDAESRQFLLQSKRQCTRADPGERRTRVVEIYDGPHYPVKPSWYTDERDA